MSEKSSAASFEPEIAVLYCEQSAVNDVASKSLSIKPNGFKRRLVVLPCSSKIEVPNLLKIIEDGVDGIEVVACPEKRCRHLVGSVRAEKRIAYARTLLDQVGMGAERLGITRGENLSAERINEIAGLRATAVKPFGKNPMRKP